MSHALGPPPGLDLSALPETPWLHGIDPRVRVVSSFVISLFLVIYQEISVLLAGVGISLLLVLLARLPLIGTLKRTISVDLFIVFLLLILPFSTPGETWFTIGPFVATWEGWQRAVEIGLKAMGVVLTLLALLGTLEPPALGHALYRLSVSEKLVHLLLFTVRYLDVLRQEYRRLRIAMKARAFVPRSNVHTWQSFGYLFGMVLVRSLERSERVLAAMKCRGYTGRFHLLDEMRISYHDHVFGALLVVTLMILSWGEWS